MKLNTKQLAVLCGTLLVSLAAHAGEWIEDQNGCRVWNDNPSPGETITWSGGCQAGYANGKGIQSWFLNGKAGGKYEGEMRDGRNSGKGTHTWANGKQYTGDWVDGNITGKGTYTWTESNRNCGGDFCYKKYVGEFHDGKITCGKADFWNGDSYDGCFYENGAMKGKTKFQLAAKNRLARCPHVYAGRSVVYNKAAWGGFLTGTVLGFSAQQGVATIRPNHSSEPVEVLCSNIEE